MSVLISTHHKDKVKSRSLDMSPEQEGDRYKKTLFLFKESQHQKPGNQFECRGQLKMIVVTSRHCSGWGCCAVCCLPPRHYRGVALPSQVLLTHYARWNSARSPQHVSHFVFSRHFEAIGWKVPLSLSPIAGSPKSPAYWGGRHLGVSAQGKKKC